MHRCSPAIRHGIWNTSPPSPHRAGVKLWRNTCSWCYRNSSRAFSCQPARGVRTDGPSTGALWVLPHTPGPFANGAAQCSVGIEQCLWWVSLGSSKRSHLHRAVVLCPLNYCAWKVILKINCEDLYFVSTSSQVVYLDYFVKFYTENNWKKNIFFSLCFNQKWEILSDHISPVKPEQNYLEQEHPTAGTMCDSHKCTFTKDLLEDCEVYLKRSPNPRSHCFNYLKSGKFSEEKE